MTHTPGPWEWYDDPGEPGGWGHAGPTLVAAKGVWRPCEHYCQWVEGDPHSRGKSGTPGHEHYATETVLTSHGYDADSVIVDNEADKALIAAAPDLLDALRQIVASGVVFDARGSHSKRVVALAREAIAKAKG